MENIKKANPIFTGGDIVESSNQNRINFDWQSDDEENLSDDDQAWDIEDAKENGTFKNKIEIGTLQSQTKLQKILKLLQIEEAEYIWWSEGEKLDVNIPKELLQQPQTLIQTGRSKSVANLNEFNPNQANTDVIITRFHLYVFNIEDYRKKNPRGGSTVDSRGGSIGSSSVNPKISDNLRGTMPPPKSQLLSIPVAYSSVLTTQGGDDSKSDLSVKNVQKFALEDFEFLQKLKNPKLSFILVQYNKEGKASEDVPQIQIICSEEKQIFIMTHILEKQLPYRWQIFFEDQLKIKQPDCYQYHCNLIKKNSFGSLQQRFFVLTQAYLFNCKCKFDSKTKQKIFESIQWQMPIKTIKSITLIQVQQKKFEIKIFCNKDESNKILIAGGYQKIDKDKREIEFEYKRATTARDFIWHIKRLHHWWNCQGKDNNMPSLHVEVVK